MITASVRVLRELEAEPRTFHSVKQAMLWYRDQYARRLRVNRDPSAEGTPRNRAATEQANATFAKIANCTRAAHHSDPRDEDEAAAVRYRVSGEMLLWLVAWYEGTWGDGSWLAQKAGVSRWAFTRRCKRTERVLRNRLEAAGLLDT